MNLKKAWAAYVRFVPDYETGEKRSIVEVVKIKIYSTLNFEEIDDGFLVPVTVKKNGCEYYESFYKDQIFDHLPTDADLKKVFIRTMENKIEHSELIIKKYQKDIEHYKKQIEKAKGMDGIRQGDFTL